MARSALVLLVAALAAPAALAAGRVGALGKGEVFSWGHAPYTYGPLHCTAHTCDVVPSCNRALWAKNISEYNQNAPEGSQMNIVYAYGGDIEFWAGKEHPDGCEQGKIPVPFQQNVCNVSVYFDPNNQAAAEVYKNTQKVESIVALLDSRMDGWDQITTYNNYDGCKFGNFYPNLVNLTDGNGKDLGGVDELAKNTASLYCNCPKCDIIDGLQVDLEPYSPPYNVALELFVESLAKYMLDADGSIGCRDSAHPKGRTVSYFTFAHRMHPRFTDLLGPNGYYVFSGYDLEGDHDTTGKVIFPPNADGGFMYNTVATFRQRLEIEISYIADVLVGTSGTSKGKFTLALPVGASCHEYEQYVPMKGEGCGPACEAQINTATMADYVQAWIDVLQSPETTQKYNGLFCLDKDLDTQFLGMSLWSYSYQMTYPPMKWFDNEFLPGAPPADAMKVLNDNLYKFTDGTTCTKEQLAAREALLMEDALAQLN